MSVIEQVLDYWRPLHESGECGGGVHKRFGPCGPGAICPFCVSEASGVDLCELLEG